MKFHMDVRVNRRGSIVPMATGIYGMAVALAIQRFGDISPPLLTFVLAGAGATISGWMVSNLFGRKGLKGWGMAYLAAILATLIGAVAAAMLFVALGAPFDEGVWNRIIGLPLAVAAALLYVLRGILFHAPVFTIWIVGAALVHMAARRISLAAPYLWDLDN